MYLLFKIVHILQPNTNEHTKLNGFLNEDEKYGIYYNLHNGLYKKNECMRRRLHYADLYACSSIARDGLSDQRYAEGVMAEKNY